MCEKQNVRDRDGGQGNSDRASEEEPGRNKETERDWESDQRHKRREMWPGDNDTDYRCLETGLDLLQKLRHPLPPPCTAPTDPKLTPSTPGNTRPTIPLKVWAESMWVLSWVPTTSWG